MWKLYYCRCRSVPIQVSSEPSHLGEDKQIDHARTIAGYYRLLTVGFHEVIGDSLPALPLLVSPETFMPAPSASVMLTLLYCIRDRR